jgi:hypothetical protein
LLTLQLDEIALVLQEWEARQKQREEDLATRGIPADKPHLLQTAKQAEEMRQKKKRKEDNNVVGWDSECFYRS